MLAITRAIEQDVLPYCEIAIVICNIPGADGAEATRATALQTVTTEGRRRFVRQAIPAEA